MSDSARRGDTLLEMTGTDLELLNRYACDRAEEAFAEIVRRHLNLVHSAAFRQVRSPQLAEEVAQSVFTDLARKAQRLAPDTILTAWLYQVTRTNEMESVSDQSLSPRAANRSSPRCNSDGLNGTISARGLAFNPARRDRKSWRSPT